MFAKAKKAISRLRSKNPEPPSVSVVASAGTPAAPSNAPAPVAAAVAIDAPAPASMKPEEIAAIAPVVEPTQNKREREDEVVVHQVPRVIKRARVSHPLEDESTVRPGELRAIRELLTGLCSVGECAVGSCLRPFGYVARTDPASRLLVISIRGWKAIDLIRLDAFEAAHRGRVTHLQYNWQDQALEFQFHPNAKHEPALHPIPQLCRVEVSDRKNSGSKLDPMDLSLEARFPVRDGDGRLLPSNDALLFRQIQASFPQSEWYVAPAGGLYVASCFSLTSTLSQEQWRAVLRLAPLRFVGAWIRSRDGAPTGAMGLVLEWSIEAPSHILLPSDRLQQQQQQQSGVDQTNRELIAPLKLEDCVARLS